MHLPSGLFSHEGRLSLWLAPYGGCGAGSARAGRINPDTAQRALLRNGTALVPVRLMQAALLEGQAGQT
jgi:hypothetical protein